MVSVRTTTTTQQRVLPQICFGTLWRNLHLQVLWPLFPIGSPLRIPTRPKIASKVMRWIVNPISCHPFSELFVWGIAMRSIYCRLYHQVALFAEIGTTEQFKYRQTTATPPSWHPFTTPVHIPQAQCRPINTRATRQAVLNLLFALRAPQLLEDLRGPALNHLRRRTVHRISATTHQRLLRRLLASPILTLFAKSTPRSEPCPSSNLMLKGLTRKHPPMASFTKSSTRCATREQVYGPYSC